jgi:hypothetical protein
MKHFSKVALSTTTLTLYNYHPCWSVTGRFAFQRKVRSPEGFAKIFDIIYKMSSSPTATNLSLDAIFVVCWIKGSNYNWKHVTLTWEFPWDFPASGGPYYETLQLTVDPTNEKISRDSVLSNQIQDIYMSI